MKPKIDWDAMAVEVNAYLDGLGPLQRPMMRVHWADIFGHDWKVLDHKARKHPDSKWAQALARQKAIDQAWVDQFIIAARQVVGSSGHGAALAREFGLTQEQVWSLIQVARRQGKLGPATLRAFRNSLEQGGRSE